MMTLGGEPLSVTRLDAISGLTVLDCVPSVTSSAVSNGWNVGLNPQTAEGSQAHPVPDRVIRDAHASLPHEGIPGVHAYQQCTRKTNADKCKTISPGYLSNIKIGSTNFELMEELVSLGSVVPNTADDV